MKIVVSKLFSWIFLPLLAPVYGVLITVFLYSEEALISQKNTLFRIPYEAKWAIVYLFGAFSFLAPAITLLIMHLRGSISTIMLDKRSERIVPSIMVILYALTLFILLHVRVPDRLPGILFLKALSLGSLITVLICTIITLKWKVSLHAAGMGILTGFLLGYFGHMYLFDWRVLPLVFIASGVVMTARMMLGAHNVWQCMAGYAIGLVVNVIVVFFYLIQ